MLGHYSVPCRRGSYCLLFSFKDHGTFLERRLKEDIVSVPLTEEASFYIEKAAKKLDEAGEEGERDGELLLTLLFNQLMRQLLPEGSKGKETQSIRKHIGDIEAYINSNFREDITLKDIASAVFLSERQVSRIISKAYGCTLPQLINDKRLSAAEILLRNGDMTAEAIAERVGIGSESYFYTLFKKKYGLSPLRYRRQKRG